MGLGQRELADLEPAGQPLLRLASHAADRPAARGVGGVGPGQHVSLELTTEHAEEASFLWLQRAHAVHAPHYDPQQFHDLDERLAANIDGLKTAGDVGWKVVEKGLE